MNIFKLGWWDNKIIGSISTICIISVAVYIHFEKEIGRLLCFSKFNFCPDLDQLYLILMFLYIPSLCIFGALFIKNKSLFENWKKFSFIYLFIYLFIVSISPWYSGDGFLNIQKGDIAISLSILYFIFSLFFIFKKSDKN